MGKEALRTIRVGARGSQLAVAQAGAVIEKLRGVAAEYDFELVTIKTSGDRDQRSSLSEMGGRGAFVKELETALADGRIDMAVHSAKDLPSTLPEGFILAAVPERAAVEDVLISATGAGLTELLPGARLATGSPRRKALAKAYVPHIEIVPVRGNVDTRLRKLREGQFEAIILARAGLVRLGLDYHIVQVLSPEDFVPAPGQGALAVEVRADNDGILDMAQRIDSPQNHAAVRAERSLLAALQAGCSVPVGGWARQRGGKLRMDAVVLGVDGHPVYRSTGEVNRVEDAEELGRLVAEDLLRKGAKELLENGR